LWKNRAYGEEEELMEGGEEEALFVLDKVVLSKKCFPLPLPGY
jgi:hypothetical protein